MVQVRPFVALRPDADRAAAVVCPPYDVMDVAEARAMAAGNRDSFLRVSRPEVDLPGTDPAGEAVHRQGAAALRDLVARGVLAADPAATMSVYRQAMGDVGQTGVVACVSTAEYAAGLVKRHEHTRPDKVEDRTRHILALDAHDEPVFLLAPRDPQVAATVAQVVVDPPRHDLVTDDGVRHTLWTVDDPALVQRLVAAYRGVRRLYVADGHHRSAAALQVARRRGTADGEAGWFPAVIFADDELHVMPYHRAVADLAGRTPAELLDALRRVLDVAPAGEAVEPDRPGRFGMYLAGRWYVLDDRDAAERGTARTAGAAKDVLAGLAVSRLQDRVLGPLLGVADPRTDPRIRFVGGIRGVGELVRLVDSGRAAVAFALPPTSLADLVAVADADEVMPPKSTWFEPKLRSGLFVHPIHPGRFR